MHVGGAADVQQTPALHVWTNRYTQGVELLDNVECRDPRRNHELTALLDALYTNQVSEWNRFAHYVTVSLIHTDATS